MSIEKLIRALQSGSSLNPTEPRLDIVGTEKIIAALIAGQAMRDAFESIDGDDGTSWASNIKRGELSVAGQAWDEAIKDGTK